MQSGDFLPCMIRYTNMELELARSSMSKQTLDVTIFLKNLAFWNDSYNCVPAKNIHKKTDLWASCYLFYIVTSSTSGILNVFVSWRLMGIGYAFNDHSFVLKDFVPYKCLWWSCITVNIFQHLQRFCMQNSSGNRISKAVQNRVWIQPPLCVGLFQHPLLCVAFFNIRYEILIRVWIKLFARYFYQL